MASDEMNEEIKAAMRLDPNVVYLANGQPLPKGQVLRSCSDAQHQAVLELAKRLELRSNSTAK